MLNTLLLSLLAYQTTANPIPKGNNKPFDIQAHRGGRGSTVENTLPSFAYGAVSGANTLELDFGVTKDGAAVVWHDEAFLPSKCKDTNPVTPNDPVFPYNDKHIANLTLAQVKTLDCGSLRQDDYPVQEIYPGTKLATLDEFFEFVNCFDTDGEINFDIETKINPADTNSTRDPKIFVDLLIQSIDKYDVMDRTTLQSFDWRSLKYSKEIRPELVTSALYDDTTAIKDTDWLGGLKIENYGDVSPAIAGVLAANDIKADILSPAEIESTSGKTLGTDKYKPFVTQEVVNLAHDKGMQVKPWTVDTLNVVNEHYKWGVDGVITDFPHETVRWADLNKIKTAKKFDEDKVMTCLAKHNQLV